MSLLTPSNHLITLRIQQSKANGFGAVLREAIHTRRARHTESDNAGHRRYGPVDRKTGRCMTSTLPPQPAPSPTARPPTAPHDRPAVRAPVCFSTAWMAPSLLLFAQRRTAHVVGRAEFIRLRSRIFRYLPVRAGRLGPTMRRDRLSAGLFRARLYPIIADLSEIPSELGTSPLAGPSLAAGLARRRPGKGGWPGEGGV